MSFQDEFFDEGVDAKRLHHRVGVKKVSEGVFDDATLMTLYELSKKKAFERITGVVSRGKESNVYHGVSTHGEVALKVYCIEACDFKRMSQHITGDPRFSVGKNRRKLVYQWAHREYKNLHTVYGKVSCPKPYAVLNNVLVMEFIGREGIPAPKLKDAELQKPVDYFKKIVGDMKRMHAEGLVHGDLSEYNILDAGKPVLIDYSMGVPLNHPLAGELLRRDVENITKFFGKHSVKENWETTLKEIESARPKKLL